MNTISYTMKPIENTGENGAAKITLEKVINPLVKSILPLAVRNKSFIINEVSSQLSIAGDVSALASVINGLLYSVIINAKETCIRISAKMLYGNTAVISVKDGNSFNTFGVACGLQDVVPLAQKMGGDINISSERQRITTIAFKFPVSKA